MSFILDCNKTSTYQPFNELPAPARMGRTRRQCGSAKTLRIRGAPCAANRWGSKSPLPAAGSAKPLGQIISPEEPAGAQAGNVLLAEFLQGCLQES